MTGSPGTVRDGPARTLPSGLVTFVFTDIEGSTRLHQQLGPDYATLIATHDALLADAVDRHDGIVVKSMGDGVFAAFGSAASAIAACVDAMHALDSTAWPSDVTVRVRMGVHTGETVPVGDDYVSLSVHQAARIADAAHGGQILVTDAALDAAHDLPADVDIEALGVFRLKDFDSPVPLSVVHAEGMRYVDVAPRVLPLAGHNIPLLRTSFIGRDDDLRILAGLLADNALVTITGPGGIGKSRLASRAAAEQVPAYPDGVWLVELAPVAAGEVTATVAAVLGLPPMPGTATESAVARHLENRRLLVVLDNCEHVLHEVAGLVDTILSGCPHVCVIATSRQPLGLAGEQLMPLGPLPVPDDDAGPADILDTPAGRLFVARASALRPGFGVTEATAEAVTRICRRLDGLPLAIELAAARVRHLDVTVLASTLAERLEILTAQGRETHPRHRTLGALLDWSHDLLDESQQRLFRRLAVFAGGVTLDAVAAVTADDTLPTDDVVDVLADLVDRSLVMVSERQSGGVRYWLLETAREYAAARLVESGEADAVRARHRDHYLDVVRAYAPRVYADPNAVRALEAERENIRVALGEAAQRHPESALDAVVLLSSFWLMRGHLPDAELVLDELEHVIDPGDPRARARLDLARGRVLLTYRPEAVELLTRAADGFESLGDRSALVAARTSLCRALVEFGHFAEAESMAPASYAEAIAAGDVTGIATAGLTLGFLAVIRGDGDAVEEILADARSRSLSERRHTATIDDLRGWRAQLRGDLEVARLLHESALAVMEDFGDSRNRAVITMHLTEVALRAGDPTQVVERGLAAARIALQAYFPGGAVNSLLFVARALVDDDAATAARILGCVQRAVDGPDLDLSDDERQWFDETELTALEHLGGAHYLLLHDQGAAAPVEDLVSRIEEEMTPVVPLATAV